MTELIFPLVQEDHWPPVAEECIACDMIDDYYKILVPPLFVKELSVGDIISVTKKAGKVTAWKYKKKSKRTTIWLLILSEFNLDGVLKELKNLDCNIVDFSRYGCYSIDVPEECNILKVDLCLEKIDQSSIAIAFPSFRHK